MYSVSVSIAFVFRRKNIHIKIEFFYFPITMKTLNSGRQKIKLIRGVFDHVLNGICKKKQDSGERWGGGGKIRILFTH